MKRQAPTVAGIDVGDEGKRFHAVALRGKQIMAALATCSAKVAAEWCRGHAAYAVAIVAMAVRLQPLLMKSRAEQVQGRLMTRPYGFIDRRSLAPFAFTP